MLNGGIFIGGHSRTGTTLMHGLVCNHPRTISVTSEASYFRALIEAYELGLRWFDVHTCDYFDSRKDLTDFHRSLIEPYLDHIQSRFGDGTNPRVVQKEPRMTEFFPEIRALLPGSKFVVLIRDLRDVVASQIVRARDKGLSYELDEDIDRYLRTLRKLITHCENLEEHLLFVHYEGLVNWPTEVMSGVWRFLELENLYVDNETRWTTKRHRDNESASEFDEKPPTPEPIGKNRHLLSKNIKLTLEKAREIVLTQTQLDCFSSDKVSGPNQSIFFLNDIAKQG